MNGVLVDTHALIWYLAHPERLSSTSSDAIDDPDAEPQVLPVDLYVASELRNIPREQIPDMPDRIIAAVAQYFNLPLILDFACCNFQFQKFKNQQKPPKIAKNG